ncbi:hypothetical protein V8E36_001457 [Tilletia maclaganii]
MPASPLRATQSPRQSTATAAKPPRNAPRKSAVRATPQVFASPSQIITETNENTGIFPDDHTRKKRRVTFSRRQELTDYDREEPTLNIRPASEMPMPDTPSSASNLTQSSVESESMSMDMSMTGVYTAPAQRTHPSPGGSSVASSSFASHRLSSPRHPFSGRVSNLSHVSSANDDDEDSDSASDEDESMSMDMSMTNVQNTRRRLSIVNNQSMSMETDVELESKQEPEADDDDDGTDGEEETIEEAGQEQEQEQEDETAEEVTADEDLTREENDTSEATVELEVSRAQLEQTLRDTAAAESKNKNMREYWLPRLRALHAELRAKRDKEQARTEAIKSCDPDVLADLHQAIEEQSAVLNDFRQKKQRAADHLRRIQSRLDEVLDQQHSLQDAIAAAREVCQSISGCTRGEAARLLRESTHLQQLHLWKVVQFPSATGKGQSHGASVKMVYDASVMLHAELVESGVHTARPSIAGPRSNPVGKMPALRNAYVSLCKAEAAGPIQIFAADVLNDIVQQLTASACPAMEILRTISNVWTRQAQLQGEADLLKSRWPTTITRSRSREASDGLTLTSTILLKRRRAKLHFKIGCSVDMLLGAEGEGDEGQVEMLLGAEGSGKVARHGLLEGQAGWEARLVSVERVYGAINSDTAEQFISECLERSLGQTGSCARLAHACEDLVAALDA